ncbi:MAG TPA: 4-hydroxybenzoate 3-monooxygenase [Burkholderiaceae bacterium]
MQKRTQVAIIGAGPAGLLLGHLLGRAGIANVILERHSAAHVLARVRAGVLEPGTVELLLSAGLGERLQQEGLPHTGFLVAYAGQRQHVDVQRLTGKSVTIYGQTEVTRDLMAARAVAGWPTLYEASAVQPQGFDGSRPWLEYKLGAQTHRLDCDYIAGCDGFHGAARASIPAASIASYERSYPFGWLGVLADTPPVADELVYAHHENGFALCSMRSATRSRCYLQVPISDRVEDWSDARFWNELRTRLDPVSAAALQAAPALEKGIAPLRSFVAEPLRFGRLFLAGDAAHIVPPTGAKGLNLAVSDVRLLAEALIEQCAHGSSQGIDHYSARALRRVWRAERFSWWLTRMLHRFPEAGPFERKLQEAELDYLFSSTAAQTMLAENYVGLALAA